jgi:hypothetical protein
MTAHGMGLEKMNNIYNRLNYEVTDVNMMFITPVSKVNSIIQNIMDDLDITGDGAGIAYSYPITHLKGLTLKITDL